MFRALSSILAFLMGFSVMCLALQRTLPFPKVPQVREKLEYFTQHRDRFDTLFLGSSRVYRQISPKLFDSEMRARGVETRSFNFGIDAMTSPELLYVFDRILESRPENLRRVVIDLNQLRRQPRGGHDPDGLRSIYWHNFKYTAMGLNAVWNDERMKPPKKREHLWEHTAMFLKKYANFGEGTKFLPTAKRSQMEEVSSSVLGAEKDGFAPRDLQMPEEVLKEYQAALAARLTRERVVRSDPILENALAEFVRKVEALGARAYILVAPTVDSPIVLGPGHVLGSSGKTPGPVLLHFDDPKQFPELFEAHHRFDKEHLNEAGSLIYTRILAEHLAPHMREAGDPQELVAAP